MARAAAETHVDRILPRVEDPGGPPGLVSQQPDWGWFAGMAVYGAVGTVILVIYLHSWAEAASISFGLAGAVLGVWLLRAAEGRQRHETATAAHGAAKARFDAYQEEHRRLIGAHMEEAGVPPR